MESHAADATTPDVSDATLPITASAPAAVDAEVAAPASAEGAAPASAEGATPASLEDAASTAVPASAAVPDFVVPTARAASGQLVAPFTTVTEATPAVASPELDALIAAVRGGFTKRAEAQRRIAAAPEAVLRACDASGASVAHWCALLGETDLLKKVRECGGAVDVAAAGSGMRPIHWACSRGQLSTVRYLVGEAAVPIDARDARFTTPLMIAAQYGWEQLLYWLTRQGASYKQVDRDGDSAIHWAAYKDHLEPLVTLSRLGMSPAETDKFGSTCLHLAATTGAFRAAGWLITHTEGVAMASARDVKGRRPVDIARERHHHTLARLLEPYSQEEAAAPPGRREGALATLRGAFDSASDLWRGALYAVGERVSMSGTPTAQGAEASRAEASTQGAEGLPQPPAGSEIEMKPVVESS